MEHFLWVEKYRPKKIDDCVLPDRLKETFQEYINSGTVPNLMLTGTSGVGKTTVAKALCEEIGLNYLFLNSSEERGIDTLRTRTIGYASTVALTGTRKVIILDEADNLTSDAQFALRGTMEKFSKTCSFIFTLNFKARLLDALHSRCAVIDFTLKADEKPKMAALFLREAGKMLTAEGVPFEKNVLVAIVGRYFPDYRRTINEIQRYVIARGKLDEGVLSQFSGAKNIGELMKMLKDGDFRAMRKWVALYYDGDAALFRQIYDSLYDYMEPASIPRAVIILDKYQYRSAFVADKEISMVAFLTEIMVDCKLR